MIQIAPSILSADFCRLGEQVAAAQAGGADWIHCDVMDGHYVPNLTIGPLVVEAVRRATTLPIDVHLMMEEPERYIPAFVAAGANSLSVHGETCPHLNRTIQQIHELGALTISEGDGEVGVGVPLGLSVRGLGGKRPLPRGREGRPMERRVLHELLHARQLGAEWR